MRWTSVAARAFVGAVLFLTLGGPAPGAVGSCSDSSVYSGTLPGMFCRSQLHAICYRNRSGALAEPHPECNDDPGTEDAAIERTCQATANPFGRCTPPSDLAAQSCVESLYDSANYAFLPNDVPECAAILSCGG